MRISFIFTSLMNKNVESTRIIQWPRKVFSQNNIPDEALRILPIFSISFPPTSRIGLSALNELYYLAGNYTSQILIYWLDEVHLYLHIANTFV